MNWIGAQQSRSPRSMHAPDTRRATATSNVLAIALFEDERVIVIRDEQLEELHALVHDVSSKPRALAPGYTASPELIAAVDSTWIDMTLEAGEVIDDE